MNLTNKFRNYFMLLLATVCISSFTHLSYAQTNSGFINASPTIRYQYIGTYDVNKLNNILNNDVPAIVESKINYTQAKNAVKLYKVEYSSVVPEQSNRPTIASGIIAIPATGAKLMPMVSYQHGTIYGNMGVPSTPDNSWETQLMIAQFGGQGYVVIGADYFGLGSSKEKDSYIVINSQVQASYDMYEAAKIILAKENISITDFFISGWSQGGVITMAFLEKLEASGVKVKAAGTAAAQCDGFVMTNGFLSHPRKIDAPWVTCMFILTAFSFEEYYQVPGLARGVFTDEQYEVAKRVYMKDTTLEYKDFPFDLHKLIRPEYFDAAYFKQSVYGKLLSDMHPYRWDIKTPVHMYYGDIDQCLTIGLARLPYDWQKAIGNDKVEAFSVGADGTHRIAYGRAVPEWKKWFDSLLTK
jgi:pimeloyl-ACP methyl ester carboxylesterase